MPVEEPVFGGHDFLKTGHGIYKGVVCPASSSYSLQLGEIRPA